MKNTIAYTAIEATEASGESLYLDPLVANALLANRGYYEVIDGEESMPLTFTLYEQLGAELLPVTGAPIQLIQTPDYMAFLPAGTQSMKPVPNRPCLAVDKSSMTETGDDGKGSVGFVMHSAGTAFLALVVGNYEHIPFQVIVRPKGYQITTPAKQHASVVKFFKHLF